MGKSELVCQRSMFGAFLFLIVIVIVFARIDYDGDDD